MDRRAFLKLSAVTSGSLLAADWLLNSELAQAAPAELIAKNGVLKATLVAD